MKIYLKTMVIMDMRIKYIWSFILTIILGITTYSAGTKLSNRNAKTITDSECGIPNRQTYIVGGSPTQKNEYPWVASLHRATILTLLGLKSSHFCGGSLIAKQWILTAAHCTTGLQANAITVNLGDYDYSIALEAANVQMAVSQIKVHPKYNRQTMDNDISMLKLATPVSFTDTIRPICLPPKSLDLATKMVSVIGWGVTKEGGKVSSVLNEVSVPVLSNEDCANIYKKDSIEITENMLCAGYTNGGKDSCQGDSGGPLTYALAGAYVQAGIVSFGIGCARPYPGCYTRVTQYISWIQRTSRQSTYSLSNE